MISLNRRYAQLNRTYYMGKLPKDLTVRWSASMERGAFSAAHVHGLTPCDHRYDPPKVCTHSYIRIHPDMKRMGVFAEMSLLHEMSHVAALLGDRHLLDHGDRWKSEILRLVKAGAYYSLL